MNICFCSICLLIHPQTINIIEISKDIAWMSDHIPKFYMDGNDKFMSQIWCWFYSSLYVKEGINEKHCIIILVHDQVTHLTAYQPWKLSANFLLDICFDVYLSFSKLLQVILDLVMHCTDTLQTRFNSLRTSNIICHCRFESTFDHVLPCWQPQAITSTDADLFSIGPKVRILQQKLNQIKNIF